MRISELITDLQEKLLQHGDIPVRLLEWADGPRVPCYYLLKQTGVSADVCGNDTAVWLSWEDNDPVRSIPAEEEAFWKKLFADSTTPPKNRADLLRRFVEKAGLNES